MGAWKTGLFVAVGFFLLHFSNVNAQCNNGDIRLLGGDTPYRGRVEICANQGWGTVCDDFWSDADASVICRQLGYSGLYARGFSNAFFGQGVGAILLDNVNCFGNETNITQCSTSVPHNCEHTEDAGVQCNPTPVCRQNEARLRGGTIQTQGRIEVCNLETWQTICAGQWDANDAAVACRQLGFSGFNAVVLSPGSFTTGSGNIWANNLNCAGSETSLAECSKTSDTTGCTHSNDAGLSCSPTLLCNNGDLRLMGSARPNEGRIELCWNEMWGTVCNNSWSADVASVACRQLGYSTIGAYGSGFGGGSGAILLSNINCMGNESKLVDCGSDGLGMSSSCVNGHQDDAGIVCFEGCTNGAIRFVSGQNPWEGRVEVCNNQVWGTVCSDFWSVEDANVACRQAGYSGFGAAALTGAPFGQGQGPIHLDDLTCQGGERSLFDCDASSSPPNCVHAQDAGVRCNPNPICSDGDVRLVGGANDREGRVEVCFNETWGTVCDTFWSSSDGSVACAQAGYSRLRAQTFTDAHFGQGSGPIYLGDLQCDGDENRLIDCNHGGIGGYDSCSHLDDAGVSCQLQTCNNGDLRLIGGSNVREGRVEMCYNEQWGTICDGSFDSMDAGVICSQLGFSRDGSQTARFGQGIGPIFLNDLACVGTENRLLQCPYTGIGVLTCTHIQDAGVRCQPKSTLPTNVRVAGVANTTINVQWGAPQDFQSTVIRYRVNCTSSGSESVSSQQTQNNITFSLVFNSLNPFTNYTCCVEALFTDPRENAFTCGTTATLQGLPGRATNLRATPSQTECNIVLLEWDPPAEDERNGIISQYRVVVTGTDNNFQQTFSPSVNVLSVNLPACCAGYAYTIQAFTVGFGPSSSALTFRTYPDLTTPIIVETAVAGLDQISISWIIPQSVRSQGLTAYQITVSSQCFDGQPVGDAQQFMFSFDDSQQTQTVSNLMPNVPYRVLLTTTVCDADVPAYDTLIYTSQPEVPSPTINAVIRNGPSTAVVQFDAPASDPPFSFFEVSYYISDGSSTFDSSALVNTISIGEAVQLNLQDLDTCTPYWVVVNAVNCPARASSEPQMLGLRDTIPFELVVTLGNVGACDSWIATNQDGKINDVENAIVAALVDSSCGLDATCVYNSMWSCAMDDQTKATFRTTLVGTEMSSAQQQLSCLQDWGSTDGSINVGGSPLPRQVSITAPASTTPAPSSSSGGTPPYVWVIVVFVVVFAVIAIVAIVALVLVAVQRPDKTGPIKHDKMEEDDTFETRSTRSIGIVENPLYADAEDVLEMPSYSTLSAKEMEADAELVKGFASAIDYADTDTF